MPIGGHGSGLARPFRLEICTPCRAHDHAHCGPIWDPTGRRVLYCECPGWDDPEHNKVLILLPCLPQPKEHP